MKNWINGTLNLLGVVIRLSFSKSQFWWQDSCLLEVPVCIITLFRLPFLQCVRKHSINVWQHVFQCIQLSSSWSTNMFASIDNIYIYIFLGPHMSCCWKPTEKIDPLTAPFCVGEISIKKWSFVAKPRNFYVDGIIGSSMFSQKNGPQYLHVVRVKRTKHTKRQPYIWCAPP